MSRARRVKLRSPPGVPVEIPPIAKNGWKPLTKWTLSLRGKDGTSSRRTFDTYAAAKADALLAASTGKWWYVVITEHGVAWTYGAKSGAPERSVGC